MLLSADSETIQDCMSDLADLGAQLSAPQARLLARAVKRLGKALVAPTPEEALEYATAAMEAQNKGTEHSSTAQDLSGKNSTES